MSTCMRLQFSTFLDVVAYRASDISQTSSATAFTFLEDGDETRCQLTYRELDHRARSIAAHLQRVTRFGDRVIIVCPPGIDYILSSSDVFTLGWSPCHRFLQPRRAPSAGCGGSFKTANLVWCSRQRRALRDRACCLARAATRCPPLIG